jgi:hypothetical protein
MRLRVDAWMLDRRVSDSITYYGQLVKSRTVAAIVSAEFPIRFSRNITVGPIPWRRLCPVSTASFAIRAYRTNQAST